MVHLSFCLIENIGVIHCRMNPSSTTNMVNQSQLKRRGIQTKRSTHTCRKRRRRSLLAGRRGNWRRGVTGWRVETTRPGPIRMSTFKRKLLSVGFCTFLLKTVLCFAVEIQRIGLQMYPSPNTELWFTMKLLSVTSNWIRLVHFS